MYFPAGIPLAALVALIVWNTRQEAQRARADKSGTNKPDQPKAG